jgi:alanyl-tRNA synthetase
VAAGVRRIFAATGKNALEHVRKLESTQHEAQRMVKAQGPDLLEKIGKLVARERELDKKVAELEKKLLEGGGGGIDAMLDGAQEIGGVRVLAKRLPDATQPGQLRELAEKLRDKLGEASAVMLACAAGDKAQLCVMVSKAVTDRLKAGDLVRELAKHVGGSGGGRPDMAQAGGPTSPASTPRSQPSASSRARSSRADLFALPRARASRCAYVRSRRARVSARGSRRSPRRPRCRARCRCR